VKHDINAVPAPNPDTDRLLAQRTYESMRPKDKVTFGDVKTSRTRLIGGATILGQTQAANFIVSTCHSLADSLLD